MSMLLRAAEKGEGKEMSLSAGFSRTVINPGMGVSIAGYYVVRKVEGVLDDLEINGLALALDEKKVVILSVDVCHIDKVNTDILRQTISEATGLPTDCIFVAATHTHTGPEVKWDDEDALVREYFAELKDKMVEAAKAALEDLKPARVGWAVGHADEISFGRRFKMKDGSIQTNPGIGNPNIESAVMEPDRRVNVLRFDREGSETIVLVNFGNHPDTVGGNLISADWPGFMRRTLERSIPGVKCLFLNGAQGDVAHINVWGKDGYFNDTFNDFDDVIRGYGHTRYMGNYMAGSVLQVYDKVNYFEPKTLKTAVRQIRIASNMPSPEEMPEAHRINDLHKAGRDSELPYTGMMLTTVVAEAERMVLLENGPEYFEMPLAGIALGNIAILGIPGEPFTGIGVEIKKAEGWDLVLPVCNADGAEGYFPMQECYDEGGYETRSSNFKPGVAEHIIAEGKKLLQEMR